MRLTSPLYRLPLRFDAERLLAEAMQIPRVMWRPDRFGIDGYWSLNLVSCEGKDSDLQSTPMRATPALARCPYTRHVLESLETTWAEVRFRWLEGERTIPLHWDANHFWFERVRVHVPIVTDPSVRFRVDDREVSMAAGECWLFDRQRRHGVVNGSRRDRIHLVMDTVGSQRLWHLAEQASASGFDAPLEVPPWSPPDREADVSTELAPTAPVASPAQVDVFAEDLIFRVGCCGITEGPWRQRLLDHLDRFRWAWRGVWSRHRDSDAAWPQYDEALDELLGQVQQLEASADAPPGHRAAELADRVSVFGTTGGRAPVHARWGQGMARGSTAALRVEAAEEFLFRLTDAGLVFVRGAGVDGERCPIEEFLLIAALGHHGSLPDAAASLGFTHDDGLVERVEELLDAGVLRAYPHGWPPTGAPRPHASPVLDASARPPRPIAASARLVPCAEIYVRLLERGHAGIWVAHLNRFQSVDPLAVALLMAISPGCTLAFALEQAQLAHSAEVDALVHGLVDVGILQLAQTSESIA